MDQLILKSLNSPLVVVTLVGITLGGVAALIREVSFGITRLMGKSAMDKNTAVLTELQEGFRELTTTLRIMNDRSERMESRLDKVLDRLSEARL